MATIPAITLWQPWATLIAIGAKEYETRHWAINYRGPIAIHAAKRLDNGQHETYFVEPFQTVLKAAGYESPTALELGCVVAVARLTGCSIIYPNFRRKMSEQERAFGDWTNGRYAWQLADIVRLETPVPTRGLQGVWHWTLPPELEHLAKGANRG